MDKLNIVGGGQLNGVIPISGAKNAALPLMCLALLTDDKLILDGWPDLADTQSMRELLASLNVESTMQDDALHMQINGQIGIEASYDIVRKMRASILVLGPLLAQMGEARVSLPGGCAIGTRPVDLHIMVMEKLGATITLEDGYVLAEAKQGLIGNRITFPMVSVGATENALMAAVLAKGQTILEHAAKEPEITDLAECLIAMGAHITGHGTDTIIIDGVDRLGGTDHRVVPDRIEAGTFAIAAALTGGEVTLQHARPEHLSALTTLLIQSGASVTAGDDHMIVAGHGRPKPVDVTTAPYPDFPTDLQAQFMALMVMADGVSHVDETIFENRFMHVPELMRMGANISVSGGSATIQGVDGLIGAPVMATDLRASVSLVLAGLVASGTTTVHRIYHLDRGYYRLEEKLNACGANITRVRE